MQHKEPRGPRAVCDLLLEKLSAAEAEVVQLVQETGQSSGRDAQGHKSAASIRCAYMPPLYPYNTLFLHSYYQTNTRCFYTLLYVHRCTLACVHAHICILTYDASCVCVSCSC